MQNSFFRSIMLGGGKTDFQCHPKPQKSPLGDWSLRLRGIGKWWVTAHIKVPNLRGCPAGPMNLLRRREAQPYIPNSSRGPVWCLVQRFSWEKYILKCSQTQVYQFNICRNQIYITIFKISGCFRTCCLCLPPQLCLNEGGLRRWHPVY